MIVALSLAAAPSMASVVPVRRAPPDPDAIQEAIGRDKDPAGPWWSARSLSHFLAACVARERGADDTVLAELRLSASYETSSAYPRFILSQELAARGDVTRALREVREALVLDEAHGPALLLMARLELGRGQASRAVEFSALALRSMPASVEAHATLGEALVATSDLAGARAELRLFELLVRNLPRPQAGRAALARTSGLLADAASTDGHDAMAEEAYTLALRADPTTRRRMALAAFFETRGRYSEAEAAYREVAETDPLGVSAAVRRAICQAKRGDRAAAVGALESLARRAPMDAEVQQALTSLRASASAVR